MFLLKSEAKKQPNKKQTGCCVRGAVQLREGVSADWLLNFSLNLQAGACTSPFIDSVAFSQAVAVITEELPGLISLSLMSLVTQKRLTQRLLLWNPANTHGDTKRLKSVIIIIIILTTDITDVLLCVRV